MRWGKHWLEALAPFEWSRYTDGVYLVEGFVLKRRGDSAHRSWWAYEYDGESMVASWNGEPVANGRSLAELISRMIDRELLHDSVL